MVLEREREPQISRLLELKTCHGIGTSSAEALYWGSWSAGGSP